MEMVRAALYIRVSTEEQVREGYSVDAQKANLEKYAKEKGYEIVGVYADEGITARKKYKNRKELMRMLDDVEAGKIDIILFIKLDRWFRSVGDYYKIQEILDRNKVDWVTTTEHYDTTTANGRLYINIRLAVAQDESDRTSERIKFVFDKKVMDGEAIWGNAPFGYKIVNKKLEKNEKEEAFVNECFEKYKIFRSVNALTNYMNQKYNKKMSYSTYRNIVKINLDYYKGIYKNNKNFFPPYITEEDYQEIQSINKASRNRYGGKTYNYIFVGLLRCADCGLIMGSAGHSLNPKNGYIYRYYKCRRSSFSICGNKLRMEERKIENYLLDHLEDEIRKYKVTYKIEKEQPIKRPVATKHNIEKKINRLRKIYLDEVIELEDYKKEYLELQKQLEAVEKEIANAAKFEEKDFTELDKLLQSDFKEMYDKLDNLEKRALWQSVIKAIYIKDAKIVKIEFK